MDEQVRLLVQNYVKKISDIRGIDDVLQRLFEYEMDLKTSLQEMRDAGVDTGIVVTDHIGDQVTEKLLAYKGIKEKNPLMLLEMAYESARRSIQALRTAYL